jgi:hypothetical protein
MIQPDKVCDETLEYAAQLVETPHFLELRGVMAKRKRAREDAELRRKTWEEFRTETASYLRAMKTRPELSAASALARIAEHGCHGHLVDAWPLAWKGWLNIYAVVRCNSNGVPPETEYRVELTDKGRVVLARELGNARGA